VLSFDVEAEFPPTGSSSGARSSLPPWPPWSSRSSRGDGLEAQRLHRVEPEALADNNANRQLGIIQAARESARVFRDHLTKVSATEYDANLVDADTKLRNDEYKFCFPRRVAVSRCSEIAAYLRHRPRAGSPISKRSIAATSSSSAPANLDRHARRRAFEPATR